MDNTPDLIKTAPTHHPPGELLVDYAGGSASEAEALMIAIHLDACAECRRAIQAAEAIGGALLDAIAPARVPPALFQRTLVAIDRAADAPTPRLPTPGWAAKWSAPIRTHLARKPTGAWRRLPAGFRALRIPADDRSGRLWIMQAPGNRGPLRHRHNGDEWTVVLEGGFTDETGTYGPGDFGYMGDGDAHTMVADGEGCVCLLLIREQPRYLTLAGKLLAPLLRL